LIALYVNTALKNTGIKTQVMDGLQKFIQKFGSKTEQMRKAKKNSHEIWTLFCRINQIKDLARNVFHGSALNDILEGNHFSIVFADAIDSIAQNLGMTSEQDQTTIEQFKEYFKGQKNANDALRAAGKSLLGKKNFTETDGDA
jgi:hypothetical protein